MRRKHTKLCALGESNNDFYMRRTYPDRRCPNIILQKDVNSSDISVETIDLTDYAITLKFVRFTQSTATSNQKLLDGSLDGVDLALQLLGVASRYAGRNDGPRDVASASKRSFGRHENIWNVLLFTQ